MKALTWRFRRLRFLARDTRAATAVEFAMVGPIFMLLECMTIELGLILFTQSAMDYALRDAGRLIRTNQASIWVDGRAPIENNTIAGGSSNVFTGVIYTPSEDPTYSGSSTSTNGCTQLVANQIKFSGTSSFGDNCTGTGVVTIATGSVLLTN